ncbi:centrosomal protein of 97 kDa isoform X2 [Anguilla rostrata]|uniref:centrosomal protein of 97 kDa isoform X2 n=1 Tax=Anguilla rostrata TaxID=7938 RepID=UPI0030CE0A53
MGVPSLTLDTNGSMVDLSGQGLQKLEPNFPCPADTHTLILDRNHIIKLEHLEKSHRLQQLSVASNRLVRMMGVSQLTSLKVLNLPNNSIGYIEGLKELVHLEWLNLAGNNIKVMEQINTCVALQHLDLSDNNISQIGDLTKLSALKTLLLHGNIVTTLRAVPAFLPSRLTILSLAENEIRDLNEVSYLAPLLDLEQLSIMSNPCVMATPSLPGYDYRPYIVSWCLSLKVLDGYVVSQKEGLKAEWLYSQGKGRSYRPGQHVQLVQYLASVCPLTSSSALQSAEDAKLEKILNKQRLHQRQLLQQTRRESSPSPPRPTQLDVEQLHPCHALPGGVSNRPGTPEAPALIKHTDPGVQVNSWLGSDHSYAAPLAGRTPPSHGEPLYLEDVQTDEDRLHCSLLCSESTFLYPSPPQAPAHAAQSDSEEETYEPDSLAPDAPQEPRRVADGTAGLPLAPRDPPRDAPQAAGQDPQTDGGRRSLTDGPSLQTDGELVPGACSDCAVLEAEPQQEEEVVARCNGAGLGAGLGDGNAAAAVRIQAWWRGLSTRRFHPLAKEVRSEIRLRRMQEHIVHLSAEMERMQREQEEERLQRLVQEEAVRFLWTQLQSVLEWQRSVQEQLQGASRSQLSGQRPLQAAAASTLNPACSEASFPDSGFQSTGDPQGALEDSLCSGTGESVETVRAGRGGGAATEGGEGAGADSQDSSLLQQYLSSVQQLEEAEEGASDRTGTPLAPSPIPELAVRDSPSGVNRNEETERQKILLEAGI